MAQVSVHPDGGKLHGAAGLDALSVASATFRDHDTDRREALAAVFEITARDLGDVVLLHTCHRVELIAFGPPVESLAALPETVERRSGLAAAERVLLVAAGLDSAVVAEEQVLGQVRDSYRSALSQGRTGPVTNELLRRSIHFGKRVQSFAQPTGERSLADRAVHWLQENYPPTGDRPAVALVVGTGHMGRVLATGLATLGATVTVASRSADRAATVAAALPDAERHATALISDVVARPLHHDLVAIAVRSGTIRLESRHLAAPGMLVVDLSTPGAVTPEAAARLGERFLGLDRLGVAGHARLSASAERQLRREAAFEAQDFAAWVATRASADGIALLQAHGESVRQRHLDRLRRKNGLTETQAAAVEAMTVAMLGELLHEPIVRLRQDPDAAERVRDVFGLE